LRGALPLAIRGSAAAGLFLLAVIASGDAKAGPVRSLLEIRRENVVMQAWDASCGAAALATVLTHTFADPVAEKSVARDMLRRTDPLRVKVRGGFSLLDMKRYLESRGYTASGYRGLSVEELAAMRSPIVVISEYGDPHFVVVRAIREGRVLLADPAFGNRSISLERFRAAWQEGIGLVVSRK
jgi:uncharacterized protein